MTDNIYTKGIINNIYSKMNITSNTKCKSRFSKQIEYQMCSNQSMADNANVLITRLKGQLGGCIKTKNPRNCAITINKLIKYLEKKQEQHEKNIDQLKELEG